VALGGACWLLVLVFFVGQAVAQVAMKTPYSFITNEISDLGSTTCGPVTVLTYHVIVCSPLHQVMNATFIVAGLLTVLGAIGTRPAWPRRRLTTWGLAFLALSGVSEMGVGLAPEDVHPALHVAASIPGILGLSVAVLLLGGAVWRARRWTAAYSLVSGAVGLFGFFIAPSLGVGTGAAERLAGYPGVAWQIVLGVFLLWSATRSRGASARSGAGREAVAGD
jgi:hypothetical membrane protein